MGALYEKIFELEANLEDLESQGEKEDMQQSIKKDLVANYAEIDVLQQKAYKLFEIPDDRYQKLLETKQEILAKYENTTMIEDVFIDHSDESIQIVMASSYFDSDKDSVETEATSIADANEKIEAPAVGGIAQDDVDIGDIKVGVNHFTESSAVASDLICAQLHSSMAKYTYSCNQATIAFPATRDSNGDRGFVTSGHAFLNAVSTSVGSASTNIQVFQPGPDPNNVDGVAETSGAGDPLSNHSWQQQLIGKLTHGVNKDGTLQDSAFVKLESGKTVDAKVKLWRDHEYSITSYESTSSQSVGDYVYQSGAATDQTSGYIISKGNARGTYADYNECKGDSGAPVGQYSSGFKVFGMHTALLMTILLLMLMPKRLHAPLVATDIPYIFRMRQ